MARRYTHHTTIGTIPGSPYYHRSGRGAPLWASCEVTMLVERLPQDEGFLLEERGLKPCRECWPTESKEAE